MAESGCCDQKQHCGGRCLFHSNCSAATSTSSPTRSCPSFPSAFSCYRTVFAPLVPVIGYRAVLGLSGYVISNIAFVFSAVYFYRYSESLFSIFSIGGFYHLVSGSSNIAVLWLALSGCARSNGVLNADYFCFQTMHQAYDAAILKKRTYLAVQALITGALRCICIFVPFIAFQGYGYYNICLGRLPNEMRPWCKASVPLLYNYIQSHYWGVGFLRYFQFKQLPNCLLASPILTLARCSIVHYVKSQPKITFSLGFQASIEEQKSAAVFFSVKDVPRSNSAHLSEHSYCTIEEIHNLRHRKQMIKGGNPAVFPFEYKSSAMPGYLSAFVLPFILHLAFMAATAFFIMHVQVATRALSASHLIVSRHGCKKWANMIWVYCAAYILLGSLLFSNFYPFT